MVVDIIAKQHFLPSSTWLASQLRKGGGFSRIVFSGKGYSTVPATLAALKEIVEIATSEAECFDVDPPPDGLVLLDEGGGLHAALPSVLSTRSAIVEQTTFGLRANWKCPAVLVCRSAAKLLFESQIISRGVVRKLQSLGLIPNRKIGVIGLGALGSSLTRELLELRADVRAYEIAEIPADLQSVSRDLNELLGEFEIVIGCTGADALHGADLSLLRGERIFISCSSHQVEFPALLQGLPCTGFDTIQGVTGDLRWRVLNGGYPINFDRHTEWERFEEIVLTRRLMLEGARQAKSLIGGPVTAAMLDPVIQYEVLSDWLENVPDVGRLRMPSEISVKLLRDNSEGEYAMTETPPYHLHNTTPGALAQMRSHDEPYDAPVMGLPIRVLPGVWSPAYDWSSLFYLENMTSLAGKSFLEIGSGTGVISVFAARAGASRVLATDVNPLAVENTRVNFERFDIKTGSAILSDCFSEVRGRFDVVLWNAPYHGCRPADGLERGCADENYEGIRTFFRDVGSHLNPHGKVIFGFSELGDLPLIRRLIGEAGFRVRRQLSDWRQGYNCMLFELVPSRR